MPKPGSPVKVLRSGGKAGRPGSCFAALAVATASLLSVPSPAKAATDPAGCSSPGADDKCEAWVSSHPGKRPYDLAVSRDGSVVAVAGKPDVVAYDASGEQLWTASFMRDKANDPAANGALGVAVSPDGSRVFATGQYGWWPNLINRTTAYDATTGVALWTAEAGTGDVGGVEIEISPDGSRVYALGSTCARPSVDGCANDVYAVAAFDAVDGRRLWVAHYDRYSGAGSQSPWALRVSPDGTGLYVTGNSATVAFDAATGQQRWAVDEDTGVLTERGGFIFTLDLDPSGTRVYVAGSICDPPEEYSCPYAAVAYDAATGARLWLSRKTDTVFFPSGADYTGIAASPDGRRVFVTGETSGGKAMTIAYGASNGQELWADQYGSDGPADGMFVAVSPDAATTYVTARAYQDNSGPGAARDFATVAYDSVTGARRWIARYNHADDGGDNSVPVGGLVPTADGQRVYVSGVGGYRHGHLIPGAGATETAYVTVAYDTGTGAPTGPWQATGALTTTRAAHTATLLSDGSVLAAGGCLVAQTTEVPCSTQTASTEIYRPGTGTWTMGTPMVAPRSHHAAARLGDRTVLVTGGCLVPSDVIACPGASTAELYNPNLGVFVPAAPMSQGRLLHTETVLATGLATGKVLVAGGRSAGAGALASAELYDPLARTFSSTGSLRVARAGHTATMLPDGKVLVTGGEDSSGTPLASAEVYDPTTGLFTTTTTPMSTPRSAHTATVLSTGKVLVAGGTTDAGGTLTRSAEVYNPKTRRFSPVGSLGRACSTHVAARLPDGRVLVAGGLGSGGLPRASTEIYDPSTQSWTLTASMIEFRSGSVFAPHGHTATVLGSGQVLVAGGTESLVTELYTARH
ncbi:MAG TPA: kelch repeat-containing protein [Acidimicrobiales bacterium]|nr:kelch repeat-containing protein [Acidimicrobiales bacterium]